MPDFLVRRNPSYTETDEYITLYTGHLSKLRQETISKIERAFGDTFLRSDGSRFYGKEKLAIKIYDCNFVKGMSFCNYIKDANFNFENFYYTCKNELEFLNIASFVEDDIESIKYIASQTEFNPNLFLIFATEHNQKYKSELFEFLYSNAYIGVFDFTERCLLIEDVFSGEWKRKDDIENPVQPGSMFVLPLSMRNQGVVVFPSKISNALSNSGLGLSYE